MSKRTRYKHYDLLEPEEAIKQLNDSISQMTNSNHKYEHNSLLLDLIAQRDDIKKKLAKKKR